MGVLWRKRSLLLKLVVIVGTAWFTIAFLLFTDENRTQNRIALPLEGARDRGDDIGPNVVHVRERNVPERVVPFRETTRRESVVKKEEDNNVLVPPQNQAGEMGKPVVLPANLSGEFSNFLF